MRSGLGKATSACSTLTRIRAAAWLASCSEVCVARHDVLVRLGEVTANAFAEVFPLTTAAADSWGYTHIGFAKGGI